MDKFRAETIEDVIFIMDEIIRNCRLRGSKLGYFTVLYRTTTYMVKKYCDQGGFFEDDDRMRALDVAFANIYFDSLFSELHYETNPPSASWKVSFEAVDDPNIVLLQHLLMGMNTHISLDLGVATAQISNGDLNDSLKHDFFLLNDVIARLIQVVLIEIGSVSRLMKVVNRMTAYVENYIVDHGIRFARWRAWKFAQELTVSPSNEWAEKIREHDLAVARINQKIAYPGVLASPALWLIRQQEKHQPHEIISGLSGEQWYVDAHKKVLEVLGETEDPQVDFMKRETHLMRAIQIPDDA